MAGNNIGELSVLIGADLSSFDRSISELNSKLKNQGAKLKSIGKGLTAALTLPAGIIGGAALKIASDFEQAEISLTTMLKSSEKAKAVLSDLFDFAKSTPFEFPELQTAAKSLISFGVSSDQVVDKLQRIGDISSGIGAPINEIAQIYGKARVQGRLFAEDINQLTGRGIPIIGELAKQFGVAESEVKKLVESGAIGFENLDAAFQSMTDTGGQFAGLMDAQSKSLGGLFSTLKDSVTFALADIGKTIVDTFNLKEVIPKVTEAIGTIVEKFQNLDSGTKKIIITVGALAAGIGPLLLGLGAIITIAPGVATAITVMTGPVGLITAGITALAAAVAYAYANLDALRERFQSVFAKVKNYVLDAVSGMIKGLNSFLGTFNIDILDGVAESVENLKNPVQEVKTEFKGFFESIGSLFGGLAKTNEKTAESVGKITDAIKTENKQQVQQLGLIEGLEKQLDELNAAKKRAFTVAEIEKFTSKIEEVEGKLKKLQDAFKFDTSPLSKVDPISASVSLDVEDLKTPIDLSKKITGVETFTEQMEKVKGITVDVSSALQQFAAEGITAFAESLGQLAAGKANIGDLFQSMAKVVADFIGNLGKMLILAGTAGLKFQQLFFNPAAAIVTGGILVAAASVLGAALSSGGPFGGGGGGSTGGYSPSPSFSVQPQSIDVNVTGVMQGDLIYFTNKRYAGKRDRNT